MLLAGCVALAVEGYAALVHSGGGINDVLPAYLAVALLAGLALGGGSSRWVTAVSGVLVLAQSVLLLSSVHPSQAIPPAPTAPSASGWSRACAAFGGTVAVPGGSWPEPEAGMAPAAHQDAAYDVLRATDQAGIASFRRSATEAVAARRFSAFISDGPGLPLADPP